MAIRYKNNWQTTLVEPISDSLASLPVSASSLALLNDLDIGEQYRLTLTDGANYEIVSLIRDPISQDLALERGKEGTAAAAWAVGTRVFAGLTAGMLSAAARATVKSVSGQSLLIDSASASTWLSKLTSDAVITLAPAEAGESVKVLIEQDAAGGHRIEWPDSVKWDIEYSHGTRPYHVICVDLVSLGGGAWGGKWTVYDRRVVIERYAFVWAEADGDTGQGDLFLSLVDGNQQQIKKITVANNMNDSVGATADSYVKISPDGKHLVFVQSSYLCDIYSTETWDKISTEIPSAPVGPAVLEAQFCGDFIYGFESGVGIYRIDITTGIRENTGLLPESTPQSISISNTELVMTFNRTTSGSSESSPIFERYDMDTLTLSPEQYSMPIGASVVLGSPFGVSGKHSPDGSYYAVCDRYRYGVDNDYESYFRIYSTQTAAPVVELPYEGGNSEFRYSPAWSPNGRYCGFATMLNTLHVYDSEAEIFNTIHIGDASAHDVKLMLTSDGLAVIQANSDIESLKPFATYSIATGVQVNDWAGAIYAGATDFGFTLGSNS